jgi:hypothetical protein
VAIAFSNDLTGAYARKEICQDNIAVNVASVYAGTSIQDPTTHQFLATSVMLVSGLGNSPFCGFQNNIDVNAPLIRPLTAQTTYVKLGQNPDRLETVDMSQWTIQCINADAAAQCTGITGKAYTDCVKTGVRPAGI